jgi:hypothetical protein
VYVHHIRLLSVKMQANLLDVLAVDSQIVYLKCSRYVPHRFLLPLVSGLPFAPQTDTTADTSPRW